MKPKTYISGELIIQKGEMNRDLYFLTEGVVEISSKEEGGDFILNEMNSPEVFGDFAFFYGLPRTATVKAKTDVEVFVLKYDDYEYRIKDIPDLIKPLFNTLISRIETHEKKIFELEKELSALKEK